MKIEVRGQSFDISFVNNWCREKWSDILDLTAELQDMPDETMELIDDARKKTRDERKAINRKIKELNARQREVIREVAAIRFSIVKELLSTNDIDYDHEFWLRKCDNDDINNFVVDALMKDTKELRPSKKK